VDTPRWQRFEVYLDPAKALEAVGLSEKDAHAVLKLGFKD
jgi:hypothetical protein